ncbi:hypothetical protein GCK32_019440 [Trichostrongylus colubriformis]|uniref:Uncharacterized protein n=1 Tax=Trichostrongylus colubriformis TaxID=6319 RepID=A0AAN8FGD0_TRICO
MQQSEFTTDFMTKIVPSRKAILHEERIRLEKWKRRKRIKLPPGVSPIDVIEAETDFHPKYDSAISDEGTFVNSTSNSPKFVLL